MPDGIHLEEISDLAIFRGFPCPTGRREIFFHRSTYDISINGAWHAHQEGGFTTTITGIQRAITSRFRRDGRANAGTYRP